MFRNLLFSCCATAILIPSISLAQGALGNPQPDSDQSGISTISGFVCDADVVQIEFDGAIIETAAYPTTRVDTEEICGDIDNGFGLLWNWNLLGDGPHTVRVLADGEEVDSADFTVVTLGTEFLTGESGSYNVTFAGRPITLTWSQPLQNFVISKAGSSPPGDTDFSGDYVIDVDRQSSSCSSAVLAELPENINRATNVEQNGSRVIFEIADEIGNDSLIGQVDADGDFTVSGIPDGGDVDDCIFSLKARMSGNFNTTDLDLVIDLEEVIGSCRDIGLPCTATYEGTIE